MCARFVALRADNGPSPREPDATCSRCGTQGTVARVTRHSGSAPTVQRFCRTCWSAVRGDISPPIPAELPRTSEELGPFLDRLRDAPIAVVSSSWEEVVDYLRLLSIPSHTGQPADADTLAEIARDIVESAADMDGPMPPVVQEFVERHWRGRS